ncbi:F-box only protein 13 [Forsythia ovata]|uniref:F-box only protein 13 n=1 Tax=Forsythia ovata TaxID=205694 RepID=A0ABD1W765_9LAMI
MKVENFHWMSSIKIFLKGFFHGCQHLIFVRNTSVCKRWKSVADSATFKLACSQIPAREPWFFMVDFQPHLNYHPIVFDSTEKAWKKLNFLPLLQENQYQASCCNFIPVAASGGLICFHRAPGEFIACNPVTGSSRQLASLDSHGQKSKPLQAIAMTSTTASFELVSVSGEYPYSTLSFRIYNSSTDQWEENAILNRKIENPVETETDDDFSLYFLSKCGNVISTNLQRNPCKQYSSVIILKDNEEILYFLSSSGTVVSLQSYTQILLRVSKNTACILRVRNRHNRMWRRNLCCRPSRIPGNCQPPGVEMG